MAYEKIEKIEYLNFIKKCLRSGLVDRKSVSSKFVKKWQVSERTFDRYWKIANIQYVEEAKEAEARQKAIDYQNEEEAARRDIITKFEMQEIATKIARSDQEETKDRLKALEFLARVEGLFAPTKIASTDTDGNSIIPATITTLKELLKK